MLKSINKYSLVHPLISPEFFVPTITSSPKIKALLIYDDIRMSPDLMYDDNKSILQYAFSKTSLPQSLPLHSNYHIYLDELGKFTDSPPNIIATQFYRLSLLNSFGITSTQTIHGPIVVFGSIPPLHYYHSVYDYSVPYEVVEQVIRLYKNYV